MPGAARCGGRDVGAPRRREPPKWQGPRPQSSASLSSLNRESRSYSRRNDSLAEDAAISRVHGMGRRPVSSWYRGQGIDHPQTRSSVEFPRTFRRFAKRETPAASGFRWRSSRLPVFPAAEAFPPRGQPSVVARFGRSRGVSANDVGARVPAVAILTGKYPC